VAVRALIPKTQYPNRTPVTPIRERPDGEAGAYFWASRPHAETVLTSAESEVLDLIRAGLTNSDIAQKRGTSTRTVINQIAHILRKSGVCSRRELKAMPTKGARIEGFPGAPAPASARRMLTPREDEAFALASMGKSNKLIAYELGIGVSTVGTLLSRAKRKLMDGDATETD
jgi:DNA-binding CsgD family transcriptional regulator